MVSIVHLYASKYGYTRDHILDNVYVDEYILQQEMIVDEKRQDWLMKSYISMLPNFEEKARQEFLQSLQKEEKYVPVKENQETDFEAIKRAKELLAMMQNTI